MYLFGAENDTMRPGVANLQGEWRRVAQLDWPETMADRIVFMG